MANDFWEQCTSGYSRYVEDDYSHMMGRMDTSVAASQEGKSAAQSSLICPDTGKVTMHATDNLRAMLGQLRH